MTRWLVLFAHLLLIMAQGGCASNVDEFSEVVKVDQSSRDIKAVTADQKTGLASYDYEGKKQSVEWLICANSRAKSTVVLFHDGEGFKGEGFCQSWIPQVFLGKGFGVLAVNRPGFGQSSGAKDLAGPFSLVAVDSALKEALGGRAIDGVWGEGEGAIGAAFFAKKTANLQWMILGNGFFDLEAAYLALPDGELKKLITELKIKEKDAVFEQRSIAWDFAGIPKQVYLYHGQNNVVSNPTQVTGFRDTIVTREYKVNLNLIETATDQLTDDQRKHVLIQILESIAPSPQEGKKD